MVAMYILFASFQLLISAMTFASSRRFACRLSLMRLRRRAVDCATLPAAAPRQASSTCCLMAALRWASDCCARSTPPTTSRLSAWRAVSSSPEKASTRP